MRDGNRHYCNECWAEIRPEDYLCDDCTRRLARDVVDEHDAGDELDVDVVEIERPIV